MDKERPVLLRSGHCRLPSFLSTNRATYQRQEMVKWAKGRCMQARDVVRVNLNLSYCFMTFNLNLKIKRCFYHSYKMIKYLVPLILLKNDSKFSSASANFVRSYIFFGVYFYQCYFCYTNHSRKLVKDRISIIRNLLPIVPNPIKFGGVAHDQQDDVFRKILSGKSLFYSFLF